jgi:hypothetical protein
MIIATSGTGSSTRLTRIISSSSFPSYSVAAADSKTYQDSALISSKIVRGLFILGKDNLVALIYDTSTTNSEVATLNLLTLFVSY